jgi:type VI secretion system protein ImpH
MAAAGRLEAVVMTASDVRADLMWDPTAFEFFQAVRILARGSTGDHPVGGFRDPAGEPVRFTVPPSLAFPPSAVQAVDAAAGGPSRMTVTFMGLVGPQGVLPNHYTQMVADRAQRRDRGLRDFLDIFQHRIVSLFYRSWEKYRFPVAYERGRQDPVTRHLRDMIGVGGRRAAGDEPPRERAPLFYAGLFVAQPRSAQGLAQLLGGYFEVPVAVEQFIGGWYTPAGETQCVVTDDERLAGRLGAGDGEGLPLGWSTWVCTQAPTRDPDDTVLTL